MGDLVPFLMETAGKFEWQLLTSKGGGGNNNGALQQNGIMA